MTPMSFSGFRGRLETASGFQSAQFRALEFVLGQKRAEIGGILIVIDDVHLKGGADHFQVVVALRSHRLSSGLGDGGHDDGGGHRRGHEGAGLRAEQLRAGEWAGAFGVPAGIVAPKELRGG